MELIQNRYNLHVHAPAVLNLANMEMRPLEEK
jgi:hypothetical protein